MSIKVVVLFQDITAVGVVGGAPFLNYAVRSHLGGWSESIYFFSDSVSDCVDALKIGAGGNPALLPSRAALLSGTSNIIGVRLYQGGAGKGQSFAFAYPGPAGVNTDVPQMALLCRAANVTFGSSRLFTLRGIPDVQVVGGEWIPSPAYANLVGDYFRALQNFAFRGLDPAIAKIKLAGVSAGGVATSAGSAIPWGVGTQVTISKVVDADGLFRSWTGFITAAATPPPSVTIPTWPWGLCTGGTVTIKSFILSGMLAANIAVRRVVVRKIGRPFEQYHGRRSKRRRTA